MTVYFVISLPKIPYIHHIYMVLANPKLYWRCKCMYSDAKVQSQVQSQVRHTCCRCWYKSSKHAHRASRVHRACVQRKDWQTHKLIHTFAHACTYAHTCMHACSHACIHTCHAHTYSGTHQGTSPYCLVHASRHTNTGSKQRAGCHTEHNTLALNLHSVL